MVLGVASLDDGLHSSEESGFCSVRSVFFQEFEGARRYFGEPGILQCSDRRSTFFSCSSRAPAWRRVSSELDREILAPGPTAPAREDATGRFLSGRRFKIMGGYGWFDRLQRRSRWVGDPELLERLHRTALLHQRPNRCRRCGAGSGALGRMSRGRDGRNGGRRETPHPRMVGVPLSQGSSPPDPRGLFGGDAGSRTRTGRGPSDFKSDASTSSATSPWTGV